MSSRSGWLAAEAVALGNLGSSLLLSAGPQIALPFLARSVSRCEQLREPLRIGMSRYQLAGGLSFAGDLFRRSPRGRGRSPAWVREPRALDGA